MSDAIRSFHLLPELSPDFCLIPGFGGSCYREDAGGFEYWDWGFLWLLDSDATARLPRPRGFSLGRISVTGWGVVRPGSPCSGKF